MAKILKISAGVVIYLLIMVIVFCFAKVTSIADKSFEDFDNLD